MHVYDPERGEEDSTVRTPLDPPPDQSRGSIPDAIGLFAHYAHHGLRLPVNMRQETIEAAIRKVCEEQEIDLTGSYSGDLLKIASTRKFWERVEQVLNPINGSSPSPKDASPPTTGDFPVVSVDDSGAHSLPSGGEVAYKAA